MKQLRCICRHFVLRALVGKFKASACKLTQISNEGLLYLNIRILMRKPYLTAPSPTITTLFRNHSSSLFSSNLTNISLIVGFSITEQYFTIFEILN